MREELARSALKLFSQRGVKNVNLDEIAAHAGVTKGSFYWHYKSKKEVVLAACAEYYRNWQRRAHAEMAAGDGPLDQLERVLRFSVQSCLFDDENRMFTTEVFAMALQDAEVRMSWRQFFDTARELYVGLVQAAVARGELDVADPRLSVDWMLAALEGIKQRAAFEPQICTRRKRDAFVRGLLCIVVEATEDTPYRRAAARSVHTL
jgi:AcrR family transcriptional regulator